MDDTAGDPGTVAPGYLSNKEDHLRRLRRIDVRGLQGMVAEERIREASAAIARLVKS